VVTALGTLAIMEYGVISIAVLPWDSTRNDWLIATLGIAPAATAGVLIPLVVVVRIIADLRHAARKIEQWIKTDNQTHPSVQDPTPSPSSPSAAQPSSSYGWPSAGQSYTSHHGSERPPWL
jgi:hypothetical protein